MLPPGPSLQNQEAQGHLPLQEVRDADGEFDNLQAALNVAPGIGNRLAVLRRQKARQRVHLAIHEVDELHQDPGATLRILRYPAGLRRRCVVDGVGDLLARGQGGTRLDLTRIGVENVGKATR